MAPKQPNHSKQRAKHIDPERPSPLWLGLACHLGPILLYVGLLELHGMTLRAVIVDFFMLILPLGTLFIVLEMWRPARALRRWRAGESVRQLAKVSLDSFALGYVLVGGVWWLADQAIEAVLGEPSSRIQSDWARVVLAVVVLDFGYYWWHRLVLHGRGLRRWMPRWARRKHAIHHDVRDLDFFRGNVFSLWDALVSHQLPLALICVGLGLSLPATLVVFSLTMFGFSAHHINHTLWLGPLRYLLMDNHAHKLHHCRGGGAVNHGNFFSIWDRMFGTYHEDWSRCATQMHAQGVRVQSP
jgi:sterol desaturase/sphingolipid hydroxylase (fatty acid hydroxylase superfamily)